VESLRAIAAGLEERGIPAACGGKWSAVQVSRLLEATAQAAIEGLRGQKRVDNPRTSTRRERR
jgi:hypothetical protein